MGPENRYFLGHEMANAPPPPHNNTCTAVEKLMYIKLPKYMRRKTKR
jgi:hypothetical protein